MGKALCRALLFRGAVRLFALGAGAPVLHSALGTLCIACGAALFFCCGRGLGGFLLARLFLAGAQVFFVLLELRPALGSAGCLDREAIPESVYEEMEKEMANGG